MRVISLSLNRKLMAVLAVGLLCLWAPGRAMATPVGDAINLTFNADYTGSFVPPGPPPGSGILFTSGIISSISSNPYGLTGGTFSHNTLYNPLDVTALQTIYNGALELTDGANALDATYVGTFQANADYSAGIFNFDLTFTGGTGPFLGLVGTGAAGGSTVTIGNPLNGSITGATLTGNLLSAVPEPASVCLLGAGAFALIGSRKSRKAAK